MYVYGKCMLIAKSRVLEIETFKDVNMYCMVYVLSIKVQKNLEYQFSKVKLE